MYVTGDATVRGNYLIDGNPFKSYNVNLKQGWNMYTSIQAINYTIEGAHNYTPVEYISEIPDNLRWGL